MTRTDEPAHVAEGAADGRATGDGAARGLRRGPRALLPTTLRLAIRHLTVLPLRRHPAEERTSPARSLVWFPVVGLLIGLPVYGVLLAPIPALPRAALALAVWTALTGALHEDGLMDCADAAFAIAARERRLEILKDPRVGAHGVTVGGLVILLRFGALAVASPAAALLAPVLGRWLMALTLARVSPARADGLGASFAAGARAWPATVVALALGAALWPLAGPRAPAAAGLALVTGGAAAAFLARRFGGLTGDGYGAVGLLAETASLYAFLPVIAPAGG